MDFAFRHGGGDAKNLLPVTVVHHECAGARLVDRFLPFLLEISWGFWLLSYQLHI